MFDPSAPILQVGKAYLIGESQRGLLITNDIKFMPVLPSLTFEGLNETVMTGGRQYEGLADFLNKLHSGQVHIGDILMGLGRVRFELHPNLAACYRTNYWHGGISFIMMACAQGFMVTLQQGMSEGFEQTVQRAMPALDFYQLSWVDREGYSHVFTDVIEVQ